MKDLIKSVVESTCGIPRLDDVGIDHPVWEYVAPVISENQVLGSCFFVAPGTALTAGHVLNHITKHLPPLRPGEMSYISMDHSVYAVRVNGNHTDTQRMLAGVSALTTDIAFLTLKSTIGQTGPEPCLRLAITPPPVGSKVVAYGRPDVVQGTNLESKCYQVICNVVEVHGQGRDQRLPFACFRVDHDFPAGMSGGPVFDEDGHVCGLVCSGGFEAYVALLWPAFSSKIGHDVDGVIRDEPQSIIDFFNQLKVPIVDLEKFSLTDDGRPQYHHGFGTAENPYVVNSEVSGPSGVKTIIIQRVFDTGMIFTFAPIEDSEIDFANLGKRCIHYLLEVADDQISWKNNKNTITVTWESGFVLSRRLFQILLDIENRRLGDAKEQQESVIERWEMDNFLGRFQ